jgi:quercetin dioxygenase-like cupin family protein
MVMRTVRFTRDQAQAITRFDSRGAFSVALANGAGEAHVYCVHLEPGGCIGEHVAGYCQLFLVVQGSGGAAGADGVRVALSAGDGVLIERGERHSKGSEPGMTALMLQVTELAMR